MSEKKPNFSITCSLLSQYLKKSLDHQPKDILGEPRTPKVMSLLPGVDVSVDNQAENLKEEAKDEALTIFYDGKVMAFDKFPAEKANDLFLMANKEINANAKTKVKINGVEANLNPKNIAVVSKSEEALSKPANASDMPIARRNSLHRFLEKRKERINTNAPYPVHSNGSSKHENNNTYWLGLGPHCPKINEY